MSTGAIIAIAVAIVTALVIAMRSGGPKVTTIETRRVKDDETKDGGDA